MEFMDKFFGVVMLFIGIYSFITIFMPEKRLRFGDSQIKTGLLSSLGFTFIFIPAGVLFLFAGTEVKQTPPLIGIPIILGFVISFIGFFVEMYKNKRLTRTATTWLPVS